jgi:hypothetical protein
MATGGLYQGNGTPCTPSPCGAAIGACCYGSGLCQLTDPFNCLGLYMGDWTECTPDPCLNQTGACCADAAICDIQTPANCGDVFLGIGTVCNPNPCEAIVGACCHNNGFCQITLQIDCGDFYQGDRTVCDPNPCLTSAGIDPTTSGSHSLFFGTPHPTPTTGQVEITWSLPRDGFASLTVWDAEGRQRAAIFQGDVKAGPGRRILALGDANGRILPSGIYWLKLDSGKDHAVQKVVIAN